MDFCEGVGGVVGTGIVGVGVAGGVGILILSIWVWNDMGQQEN